MTDLSNDIRDICGGILENAKALMSKGESAYAAGLLDAMRRFERLLPDEPEPPREKSEKILEASANRPLPPPPPPPPPALVEVREDKLPEGI